MLNNLELRGISRRCIQSERTSRKRNILQIHTPPLDSQLPASLVLTSELVFSFPFLLFTDPYGSSPSTHQIVLSTAHPAKFSEAVSKALSQSANFNFERDVFPQEFKGLLEKERRVVDVPRPEVDLVKEVIEQHAI